MPRTEGRLRIAEEKALACLGLLHNRAIDREKLLETFVKREELLRRLPLVTRGQGVGWSLNMSQAKGMSWSVKLPMKKTFALP